MKEKKEIEDKKENNLCRGCPFAIPRSVKCAAEKTNGYWNKLSEK